MLKIVLPSAVSRNFRAYRSLDFRPLAKLNTIAHDFGIVVNLWQFGEHYSACLLKLSSGWRIVLNLDEPETRRTFSLAHELGHYFLHRHHNETYFACSPGVDQGREREANLYAARLLMPSRVMVPLAEAGMDVDAIADLLKLSKHAVQIRLEMMGLK